MTKKNNELQVYKKTNLALDVKQAAWNSLSDETQKAYNSDFKLFFEVIKKDLKSVTANDVLEFVEYLRKNDYQPRSINRKIASLSKMFRVLKFAGEINENPVEVLKQFKNISMKVNKEVRNPLTMDDIKTAIRNKKNFTELDKRIVLIIRMLAKSGLRISELIHIKNKDITVHDENNMLIRIIGKGRKERFIFIENNFLKEIKSIYPNNDKTDYLFYTYRMDCFDRRVLWKYIKDFFWKTIKKDVHPHLLRHSFATHKIGVEKKDIKSVSKFLGHSTVSITIDSYVDTALNVDDAKIKI